MDFERLIRRQKRQDRAFQVVGFLCTLVGLVTLLALLGDLAWQGASRIDWQFLTSFPSRKPDEAGILAAWVGTLMLMSVTAVLAIPLGIAAAVYLEEYAKKGWLATIIEVNIANLAGVPSIIYALMLGMLMMRFRLKVSVLLGGVTLGLLVLPIVIVATREAIRAVPSHIREAAFALGATRWQMIRHHLLPYSTGGIATGVIIALSRAIGETAPLITIGALTFIRRLPPSPVTVSPPSVNADWLHSKFTALPIQMFHWVQEPEEGFPQNAAAAGLVLIAFTLALNAVAIVVRHRMRRRIKW